MCACSPEYLVVSAAVQMGRPIALAIPCAPGMRIRQRGFALRTLGAGRCHDGNVLGCELSVDCLSWQELRCSLRLACIGLFGLMSYNVARRTSEIGVRLALGAQRRAVIGMMMSESIWLVAIGVVLGLAAVLWAGRFVQTVVYGLSPSDPLTIGGAVALIAGARPSPPARQRGAPRT